MPHPSRNELPRLAVAAVVCFCACFTAAAIANAWHNAATYDETSHLPAGYAALAWHDYRLNPEQPPLLKMWAALPLLVASVTPASPEALADAVRQPLGKPMTLRGEGQAFAAAINDNDAQWLFGHLFLYGVGDEALRRAGVSNPLLLPTTIPAGKQDFLNDAGRLLFLGRLPMIALGLVLGVLVFVWSWRLSGLAGGILSLALFCFDPNFIAHSGLVTTDVGVSLFVFGAVYFLWRASANPSWTNLAAAALAFGLAISTKFSGLILLPIGAGLGVVYVTMPHDARWPRFRRVLRWTALSLMGAYVILWASYGFRFSAAADTEGGHLPLESALRRDEAVRSLVGLYQDGVPKGAIEAAMGSVQPSLRTGLVRFSARWHLFPEAYLYGFVHADMKAMFRETYVMGSHQARGRWFYFPVAFAVKTTVPALALILLSIVFAVRRKGPPLLPIAFLLLPVAIYLAMAMVSRLNIGHRHLLPVYPFLYVLCGTLAGPWRAFGRRARTIGAGFTLAAIAACSLAVLPDDLAYFNELAGGPRRGSDWLLDSNLDWGQGLTALKAWLDRRGIAEPIGLVYFGTADPKYYGIAHWNLPGGYKFEPEVPFAQAREARYVAVSATHLKGVYYTPKMRAELAGFLVGATPVGYAGHSIVIYLRN